MKENKTSTHTQKPPLRVNLTEPSHLTLVHKTLNYTRSPVAISQRQRLGGLTHKTMFRTVARRLLHAPGHRYPMVWARICF